MGWGYAVGIAVRVDLCWSGCVGWHVRVIEVLIGWAGVMSTCLVGGIISYFYKYIQYQTP